MRRPDRARPMPGRSLRHAVWRLRHAPLFTIVAVLTLAVGLWANTLIFSVVNGVLLKPLPFADPDRLVGVWHTAPGLGFDVMNQGPATYLTYREESRVFTDIGLWDDTSVSVTGLAEPERLQALLVTDGTLPLLGVQPLLGRLFTRADDPPGTTGTVVLAHAFWQRAFGGNPSAVGRSLVVDGRPREIIGVLPPSFCFDPIVLVVTLALSLAAGLLFGMIPVLKFVTSRLATSLKEGGRGSSDGRARHRATASSWRRSPWRSCCSWARAS
jgi:hypothetical protein